MTIHVQPFNSLPHRGGNRFADIRISKTTMTQTVLLNQTPIAYRNESSQKPPREVIEVTQINAEQLLKQARNGMATVWRGDFHQAKQVLSALKKRAKIQPKPQTNPSDAFHQHRLAQSQSSSLANRLLVQIDANFALNLPRAPQVQAALRDVFGTENSEPFLLPLNQLLGYIGAHEWHKKRRVCARACNIRFMCRLACFRPFAANMWIWWQKQPALLRPSWQ
ncbi:Uncharacterised protein [Kingella kingae]|nr:Uncharacterised protein [Kingella kingae]